MENDKKYHQEKVLPFKWAGWDDLDTLVFNFYDVIFTGDFGVFKEGESFSSISVFYDKGLIEAYNEEGTEVIKTQAFRGVAVSES